jgi:hypothetical protein
MNMELLRDLEKHGKQRYEDIPAFMKQRGLSLDFETRSGSCTIVGELLLLSQIEKSH